MKEAICPGLPGDWVNGWLAALGATVLAPQLRLHWTTDALPVAVLSVREADPVDVLVATWPDRETLSDLPVAENWKGKDGQDAGRLERKVPVEEFGKRAQATRRCPRYSWSLTSTMTDLCVDRDGKVEHAPFDPSGPGSIKWLHHRLVKIYGQIENPEEWIPESLSGRGRRVNDNGLGFDQTRLGSRADETGKRTDPVIEVLAFFGLAFLTARGPAVDARLNRSADTAVRQRGWRKDDGGHRFYWPVWSQPLDRDAMDALLDLWNPGKQKTWSLYGVHAAWRSVRLKPVDKNDPTRAFGAERLS